jgi:hypothetical protein
MISRLLILTLLSALLFYLSIPFGKGPEREREREKERGKREAVVFAANVNQWRGLFAALNSLTIHWIDDVEEVRLKGKKSGKARPLHVYLIAEEGDEEQALTELLSCARATLATRDTRVRAALDDGSLTLSVIPFRPDLINFSYGSDRIQVSYAHNFVRFYFPTLFPQVSRLLYLDADIIVRRSVRHMFDAFDRAVVTARKSGDPPPLVGVASRGTKLKNYLNMSHPAFAHIDGTRGSFNAGILLMNLAAWRDEHVTAQLEGWMHLRETEPLWELGTQPPLLLVAYGRDARLDERWNVYQVGHDGGSLCVKEHEHLEGDPAIVSLCPDIRTGEKLTPELRQKLDGAYILHWATQLKPWLPIGRAAVQPYWKPYELDVSTACPGTIIPCYHLSELHADPSAEGASPCLRLGSGTAGI